MRIDSKTASVSIAETGAATIVGHPNIADCEHLDWSYTHTYTKLSSGPRSTRRHNVSKAAKEANVSSNGLTSRIHCCFYDEARSRLNVTRSIKLLILTTRCVCSNLGLMTYELLEATKLVIDDR